MNAKQVMTMLAATSLAISAQALTLAVKDVKMAQRYPWNGLVDITLTLQGARQCGGIELRECLPHLRSAGAGRHRRLRLRAQWTRQPTRWVRRKAVIHQSIAESDVRLCAARKSFKPAGRYAVK